MKYQGLLVIVLSLIALATYSMNGRALGIPEYSKDLPQSLKNNCNVCHEKASGGPLNDFGGDYMMYGTISETLKGIDSDGDGYFNGEELAAGSLPGFASSYPGKKRGIDIRFVPLGVAVIVGSWLLLWKRRSN
jgi:hypothetical protein